MLPLRYKQIWSTISNGVIWLIKHQNLESSLPDYANLFATDGTSGVITTTCGDTSDKVGIMTTLGLWWRFYEIYHELLKKNGRKIGNHVFWSTMNLGQLQVRWQLNQGRHATVRERNFKGTLVQIYKQLIIVWQGCYGTCHTGGRSSLEIGIQAFIMTS